MSKKGFLFTIMTLFLLLSLLMLTRFYLYRSKEMQDITNTFTGEKIRYIESDISKSYFDILDIGLSEITRDSENGIIKIEFGKMYTIPSLINHNAKLRGYESFLEGSYSAMANTMIELNNFNADFRIEPYGITLVLDRNYLYIYTDSPESIKEIYIAAQVSVVENPPGSGFSTAAPGDDGITYPGVHVVIKDANGATALDEKRYLNPYEANNPFHLQLDYYTENPPPSPWVDIEFGNINTKQGTLGINRYGLTAEVLELLLVYNEVNEKVHIKVADSTIDVKIRGMKKQGPIILAEE